MTERPRRTSLRDQLATATRAGEGIPRELPEDCPVVPIGSSSGKLFWYLNDIGQLVDLGAQQHSKNTIGALFSLNIGWLRKNYPKGFDDNDRPKDFNVNLVAEALRHEAQRRRRDWEPGDNIRGRGTWLGEDGDLVVHLGSSILAGGQPSRPGLRGDIVYPIRPERPAPMPEAQREGPDGPAAELLAILDQWNWTHATLHPRLLLGWICGSFLCGALPWRPHVWVAAPRGSGKSTFFRMLGALLVKDQGLLSIEDSSAAALRSRLQYDSLPVALDETEPSEDNRRIDALLGLLRLASSGGTVARATVEQQSIQQTVRFQAICASVVRPALKGQDLSRITLIELRKPRADQGVPAIAEGALRILGRKLFRRMLDAWPRYHDTFRAWQGALRAARLDARQSEQIGTLLTLQWLAMSDLDPDSDTLEQWATMAADATAAERVEDKPEWFRCIETLVNWTVSHDATKRDHSVVELVAMASGRHRTRNDNGELVGMTAPQMEAAQATLARNGLRFVAMRDEAGKPLRSSWADPSAPPSSQQAGPMLGHLAVANAHPALSRFFERTHWSARSGTAGAWKGVLEGAPGALLGQSIRFGHRTSRCVQVPVQLVFDGTEGEVE
jgi:energy-coupling factor transporter ATP-binding protein EcfA2